MRTHQAAGNRPRTSTRCRFCAPAGGRPSRRRTSSPRLGPQPLTRPVAAPCGLWSCHAREPCWRPRGRRASARTCQSSRLRCCCSGPGPLMGPAVPSRQRALCTARCPSGWTSSSRSASQSWQTQSTASPTSAWTPRAGWPAGACSPWRRSSVPAPRSSPSAARRSRRRPRPAASSPRRTASACPRATATSAAWAPGSASGWGSRATSTPAACSSATKWLQLAWNSFSSSGNMTGCCQTLRKPSRPSWTA
mmetsp:Transcript_35283/g.112234  ORF Transcript_35283/g.112234 Transcript_35283/m.112234 type:complete len:250 (+) Transcript_35283:125-874(+)